MFPQEGGEPRRRAPHNIFTETDMYTIKAADGERDLSIEHGLSQLEGWFAEIRRDFLEKIRRIPPDGRVKLAAFAAALKSRTPAYRDHNKQFWQHAYNVMQDMKEGMSKMTPEQRKDFARMSPPRSADSGRGMGEEEVKHLLENTTQVLMPISIEVCTPIMSQMYFTVFCTNTQPGFITSDNPVVWFDPEAYKLPRMFRSPGLGTRTIEVSLPISPRQMLLIHHAVEGDPEREPVVYIDAKDDVVHDLNRRTRAYSKQGFVVMQNYTNPIWFERGSPPDAEKVTEGSA